MKIYEIEENGGECITVLALINKTESVITGRILYTVSAYGDSIVRNRLETGKLVTFNLDENVIANERTDMNIRDWAQTLADGMLKRDQCKACLIESDRQIMQQIYICRPPYWSDSNGLLFHFSSSLPGTKDNEGVPEVVGFDACFGYYTDRTSEEVLKNVADEFENSNRLDRVSTSGSFIPETRIYFEETYLGTLENYDLSLVHGSFIRNAIEIVLGYISMNYDHI